MKLFINDLKKDLHEMEAIKKKLLHEEEIATMQRQITIIRRITEDLAVCGECIIEEQ